MESIVASRRKREGWQWLLNDARPAILRHFWAVVIPPSATTEELAAIEKVFHKREREEYWRAVANARKYDLVPEILTEFPQLEGRSLQKCIEQVSQLIPHENWNQIIPEAVARVPWPRRATLTLFRHPPLRGIETQEWLPGAFSSEERAALALCDAAALGTLSSPTPSAGAKVLLRELVTAATPHIAGLALVVLAYLNEEITTFLPRLETSGERVAQLAALVARYRTGSTGLHENLLSALRHSHFRIRAAAVDMLAPTAGHADRAAILTMALDDPSASVRRLCAAVIAREGWPEGEDVLVTLLGDQHDSGSPNEEGLDLRVARTAAEGLRSMPQLKSSTVERIYTILTNRDRHHDDVSVLSTLIFSLSGCKDPRIVPLLVTFLGSQWYVTADHDSGYPLRYSAGWALWRHQNGRPEDHKLINPAKVAMAAAHDDDRLAGSALLVLGALQENALLQLREVLDAPTFTVDRGLLLAMSTPSDAATSLDFLRSAFGKSHPVWALLNLPIKNRPKSQDEWRSFLAEQPEFLQWLRTIQTDEGLRPTIRFALKTILKFDDPEELPPRKPFGYPYFHHLQTLKLGTFVIRD